MSKDAVYALLGHLVDAFLVTLLPLASESEARQRANPRKLYPADTGLIRAFDASGRSHVGHALETTVLHELLRRNREVGYVKTREGLEVDFLARDYEGTERLVQVCADPSGPETLARELTALAAARREHPRARQILLVLTQGQMPGSVPEEVQVQAAWRWLLANDGP